MKKYISVIIALVVLTGAFLIAKSISNSKKPQTVQIEKSLPLAFVQTVENSNMPLIIPASGSLTAKDKIKLSTEVQGVLEMQQKAFKPGVKFSKGELIFKLNSDEFYSNLLAQRSTFQNLLVAIMPDLRLDFKESFDDWEAYLNAFDINKLMADLPEPKSDKEKRFVASKNIYSSYYALKNLEIKLGKFAFSAPYNGVLTEANITPGTLVSPGQTIGEFINPNVYELEVSVNSALISRLKVGDAVSVQNLENSNEYTGKIIRINEKVDLNSQTVNLYIQLSGDGLKEGLYLKAFLKSRELENIVEIPRNLLVNQTYTYIVENERLKLTPIKLVHQNDQTILVRGLKNGQLILTKPVPKSFEGMNVSVVMDEQSK